MVILLGIGRSGTTFLGKLFDTHPWVQYLHEPDAVLKSPGLPYLPRLDETQAYQEQAARYLTQLELVHTPFASGKLPLFPKAYRSSAGRLAFEGSILAGKGLSRIPGLSWLDGAQMPSFIRRADAESGNCVTVVKSVISLCRARMFSAARPELKIVHIIRHPAGVVASELRGEQQGTWDGNPFLEAHYTLPEAASYGPTLAELQGMSYEEQLTFRWMLRNDKVMREMRDHPNYRVVRYEDLCRDPLQVMGELFSFIGLANAPMTEQFIRRLEGVAETDRGYFSVVRSPMNSVERWKTALSEEQVRRIESLAAKSESWQFYA